MTVWEAIQRGEYVMLALGALFIVVLIIWWAKAASLSRDRKTYPPMMQRIRDHVMEGDVENARNLCAATGTPGASVIESGLGRIGQPIIDVRQSMQDVGNLEKNNMAKGMAWLKFIAVAAPLLGLGGSLTGIIDRLRDLGETATPVDIADVCMALAPTFVTTVAGLVVGIFALLAMTGLDSCIRKSRKAIDALEIEFIDMLNEPS